MPTPFTHLASAQRLLDDPALPASNRALLDAETPAFLLGSIAADGHSGAGLRREDTHFYTYDRPITAPLSDVMLARYPALAEPCSDARRAFIAGYVGHLALDEVWTEGAMRPYFIEPVWGSSSERFVMLNALLITMDERDQAYLRPSLMEQLQEAGPDGWLPFMPDSALIAWRDLIARQLAPGAPSGTLPIISARTGLTVADLRALVDSEAALNARLWAHVPQVAMVSVERQMQGAAIARVVDYLSRGTG
jgi:hypothetical protein